ncbi:hypothetical protein I553_8609 [Mycobacterium xenopi 4042]|uniref:Uncharacterized protein n=1 Tax=Mycobacterium xenopi 4042 TaxID=1299334 RepID=X8CL37_MYCXE|nr:hypothetical protein I553_8609 [Mycobacterium xenopi 4042]
MRLQRQVVDYALRRRSLLAEVYSGRTGISEVCDADPYLLRAAKYHGKPSPVMCPICRKEQLTLVSWVFGEHLGRCRVRPVRPKSWSCWRPASTSFRYT